jgi:uncharacterized protein (DUF3084 family)
MMFKQEIWSNSYTQEHRHILLQAYDQYTNGEDLRASQLNAKEAAKEAKIQAREAKANKETHSSPSVRKFFK